MKERILDHNVQLLIERSQKKRQQINRSRGGQKLIMRGG